MAKPSPDLSEFHDLTELEELRRAYGTLQRQLARAKRKSEDLVDAAYRGARDAMLALGPIPAPKKPRIDRRQKPEVALWHLTDWQGAKLTASYNSDVMRERVMRFCDTAARLTEIKRATIPVRKCVIAFGGDMGEGLFNFPQQPYEIDATIFTQYAQIARVEAQVVNYALGLYEEVEVLSEWGNHGRIGSKRAAVPSADNFDRMTYELARALLSELETWKLRPRLTWEDSIEDIRRIEIGNYRALLIHGDEIGRSGYASPMTIVNHVAKWQSGSYPWQFTDCYLGHYHTHNEWALPNGKGSVYQTGSPETDNRYAGIHMASSAEPSQRLHFIDPRKGRVTDQYRVWLRD